MTGLMWLKLLMWVLWLAGLSGVKRGKKRNALFQTHNWEKSSFFSTLVYLHSYTQIRDRGAQCAR